MRDSNLSSVDAGGCPLGLSMIRFWFWGSGWVRGVLGDAEGVFCFLERGIGGEFIFRVCFIREEG